MTRWQILGHVLTAAVLVAAAFAIYREVAAAW